MNRVVAILFAITCFSTSWISGSLLSVGMWFWVILVSGIVVAISQFFQTTQELGSIVAALISVISIFAVLSGLLAATVGGSFKSDDDGLLLLFSFFLTAVFGFTLVRINRKVK
jgi:hypothetical protein